MRAETQEERTKKQKCEDLRKEIISHKKKILDLETRLLKGIELDYLTIVQGKTKLHEYDLELRAFRRRLSRLEEL